MIFKQARAAIPKLVPWQGMIEELEQTIILSLRTDAETVKNLKGQRYFLLSRRMGHYS